MRRAELFEMIANGESSSVEFKRDDLRPEDLAREVVAMMNLRGGRLLLGVEDDGTISGIQRPDLEEWVMNVFTDKVHPSVLPHYEEVLLDDQKRVAVVSFVEGAGKPYVVRHSGREDVYVRRGSTNRRASREEWVRLAATSSLLHPEKLPVSSAGLADFDRARLDEYLRVVLSDPELPQTDEDWTARLVRLGFMVNTETMGPLATIAGLVLFGMKPRRFLPQAGLRLMAFAGNDKTYEARLDIVLDGPLVGRMTRVSARELEEVEPGLLARAVEALEPFVHVQQAEPDASLRRERRWLYPVPVLRELIVNAFSHRDWTRSVDVEVVVYADRLELTSPGSLPNSMTVDQMLAGQRAPRNPILHNVLRDYGYSDARGMGIRTKVVPLLRQSSGREPVFEATEDYLRTTAFPALQK